MMMLRTETANATTKWLLPERTTSPTRAATTPPRARMVHTNINNNTISNSRPMMIVPTSPISVTDINKRGNCCPNDAVAFPWRLHEVLDAAEREGFEHIISWQPDCVSFKVHDAKSFERKIIPVYLSTMTKYKSFVRQLNLYCFERVPKGPHRGCYSHPLFAKADKAMCNTMALKKFKGGPPRGSTASPTTTKNNRGGATPPSKKQAKISIKRSRQAVSVETPSSSSALPIDGNRRTNDGRSSSILTSPPTPTVPLRKDTHAADNNSILGRLPIASSVKKTEESKIASDLQQQQQAGRQTNRILAILDECEDVLTEDLEQEDGLWLGSLNPLLYPLSSEDQHTAQKDELLTTSTPASTTQQDTWDSSYLDQFDVDLTFFEGKQFFLIE